MISILIWAVVVVIAVTAVDLMEAMVVVIAYPRLLYKFHLLY